MDMAPRRVSFLDESSKGSQGAQFVRESGGGCQAGPSVSTITSAQENCSDSSRHPGKCQERACPPRTVSSRARKRSGLPEDIEKVLQPLRK
jgi:hypothetical protein